MLMWGGFPAFWPIISLNMLKYRQIRVRILDFPCSVRFCGDMDLTAIDVVDGRSGCGPYFWRI